MLHREEQGEGAAEGALRVTLPCGHLNLRHTHIMVSKRPLFMGRR